MAQHLDLAGADDGLLVANLREVTKKATERKSDWNGHGEQMHARYQPNWARNVDSAFGDSGRRLMERLNEEDGSATCEQLSDAMREYLRALGVAGNP